MKLIDLFELSSASSYRNKVDTRNVSSEKDTEDAKLLGKGSQGVAIERTKKPNMVTKVFGINSDNDGLIQFIRMAQRHQNIHFPHFENLRIINKQYVGNDANFKKTAAVDMEKLIPLNNEKIKDAVKSKLREYGVLMQREELTTSFSFDRVNLDAIKDSQLKKAIDLIRQVSPLTDMGARNIMVRLTSTGPQIVLVDPIYDPK
jgi:hypothetical protein